MARELRLFGSPQAVQRADYILPFSPRIVKRKALVNSAKFPARFLCNLMKNPAGGGSSPTICGAGWGYACPETSRSPPPRRKAHEAGRTTTKPGDAGFIGFCSNRSKGKRRTGGKSSYQPFPPAPPEGEQEMDEPLPHTQVKDQRAWGPYWICWKHKAGEPLKITQHRSDLFNQMLPHPPRV